MTDFDIQRATGCGPGLQSLCSGGDNFVALEIGEFNSGIGATVATGKVARHRADQLQNIAERTWMRVTGGGNV